MGAKQFQHVKAGWEQTLCWWFWEMRSRWHPGDYRYCGPLQMANVVRCWNQKAGWAQVPSESVVEPTHRPTVTLPYPGSERTQLHGCPWPQVPAVTEWRNLQEFQHWDSEDQYYLQCVLHLAKACHATNSTSPHMNFGGLSFIMGAVLTLLHLLLLSCLQLLLTSLRTAPVILIGRLSSMTSRHCWLPLHCVALDHK